MGFAYQQMNRRGFLRTTAAALAGGAALRQEHEPTALDTIFANTNIDDQTGTLNIPATFNKGKCLVLFGYNGCPMCQEITKTVAAAQKEMTINKVSVPIIVVSTQPEKDKEHVTEYVKRYSKAGVEESINQKRVLHVALPESGEQTIEIQKRLYQAAKDAGIKTIRNSGTIEGNNEQHSPYIAVFENGNIVDVIRGLNEKNEAPPKFAAEQAKKILSAVLGQEKTPK